jgi:hypothetical protein
MNLTVWRRVYSKLSTYIKSEMIADLPNDANIIKTVFFFSFWFRFVRIVGDIGRLKMDNKL